MNNIDFLLFALAALLSIRLYYRGPCYLLASRFLLFFGLSTLWGGIAHLLWDHETTVKTYLLELNSHIPSVLPSLKFETMVNNVWYLCLLTLGFCGYYMIMTFVTALQRKPHAYVVPSLLKITAFFYFLIITISSEFIYQALFSLLSHFLVIVCGMIFVYRGQRGAGCLLILLCVYNVGLAVLQQAMALHYIPSGPLSYNDWFHIGLILFVCAFYMLCSRSRLLTSGVNSQYV
jgi:hypothetical protein